MHACLQIGNDTEQKITQAQTVAIVLSKCWLHWVFGKTPLHMRHFFICFQLNVDAVRLLVLLLYCTVRCTIDITFIRYWLLYTCTCRIHTLQVELYENCCTTTDCSNSKTVINCIRWKSTSERGLNPTRDQNPSGAPDWEEWCLYPRSDPSSVECWIW